MDEISQIKQLIFATLLQDQEVVNIVADATAQTLPALRLRYKQVFPWPHVPGTTEEAQTYITFEVTTIGIGNTAVMDYELRVWIFTDDSLMPFDSSVAQRTGVDARGTRIDVLAGKVDHLLNGKMGYGFGGLECQGNRTFSPCDRYYGRILTYRVKGWNMSGEQLREQSRLFDG